jgi:hypothetical protein
MSRYTLIGPDPKTMGQIVQSTSSPPQAPPKPSNPHFYWLPIIEDAQPFDPWQQMRTCTYEIFSDHVQQTCQVRDMTADELTRERDINATRFDEVWMQITLDHENRIRNLERGIPQPPLTIDQWYEKIRLILKEQMS